MKLSLVIPVYNEKDTVEKVIELVREADTGTEKEIVVIDDGSTDGSLDVLKNVKEKYPEIKMHFKDVNRGKGDTLKVGFKMTTGDYIIVQDADMEYDPRDIKKLIRALHDEKADVVYGSRFGGNYKDMSNLHYFGNKLLTMVTNLLFGVMLTDMETGYKLIPGDFARSIDIKSQRFDFEPEITAKILKAKLKLKEVPITYKGRSKFEGKKITWKDGFSALFSLIRFRFLN